MTRRSRFMHTVWAIDSTCCAILDHAPSCGYGIPKYLRHSSFLARRELINESLVCWGQLKHSSRVASLLTFIEVIDAREHSFGGLRVLWESACP